MNFLNPFFLIGLLAVAVPLVIHLINLRKPQKVLFSTLAFFNELKKSTIRRLRIKEYLLMVLRTAAVLLLALALARPFLPPTMSGTSGSDEPKAVALLIDNSPSMSRIGSQGPLTDRAKNIAAAIVNNARSSDRFIIETTNSGHAGTVSLTGASTALEHIKEIEVSNTGNYTAETIQLLREQLQQSPMKQAIIYLITDGQKSQLAGFKDRSDKNGGDQNKNEKPVSFQMIKLGDVDQQNLAVTSLSLKSQMLSKETPITLAVNVKNMGKTPAANHFVTLEMENRMAGQYQVNLEPGQTHEFLFEVIPHKAGSISGKVLLEGDEVTYDNSRYFVIQVPESRSVLLINEKKRGNSEFVSYLKPALEAARLTNTQVRFTEKQAAEVDQSALSNYDAMVLDGLKQIPEYWFDELQRYVQNGNGVLFFPSEQGSVENYNAFFALFNAGSFNGIRGEYASFKAVDELGSLVQGHPILDELFDKNEDEKIKVDPPEVFFYYQYQPLGNTGTYTVLELESGAPLLNEQRFGDGKLFISAIGDDPGWSNFPVNPLFAPLYYRTVLYAASTEKGGMEEHILGSPFEWQGSLTSRSIELQKNGELARPEVQAQPEGIRIRYEGREWEPGFLQIETENDKRLVAVNQHVMESDFATLSHKELENLIDNSLTTHSMIEAENFTEKKLEEELNAAGFGEEIWNWFLWTALFLLITETLVSKLYKAETIS